MNRIVMTFALLSVALTAPAADAGSYKQEYGGRHAAKAKTLEDYSLLRDGGSAYSAQSSSIGPDPAFSSQQREIDNAR